MDRAQHIAAMRALEACQSTDEASPTFGLDASIVSSVLDAYKSSVCVGGRMLRMVLYVYAQVMAGKSIKSIEKLSESKAVETLASTCLACGFSDKTVATYLVKMTMDKLAASVDVSSPVGNKRPRSNVPSVKQGRPRNDVIVVPPTQTETSVDDSMVATECEPSCHLATDPFQEDRLLADRMQTCPVPSPLVPTEEDFDGRIVMSPRTQSTHYHLPVLSTSPRIDGVPCKRVVTPFSFEDPVPTSLSEAWVPFTEVDYMLDTFSSLIECKAKLMGTESLLKSVLARIERERAMIDAKIDEEVDDLKESRHSISRLGVDTDMISSWSRHVAKSFSNRNTQAWIMVEWNRNDKSIKPLNCFESDEVLVKGDWKRDYLMSSLYSRQAVNEMASSTVSGGKVVLSPRHAHIVYRCQSTMDLSTDESTKVLYDLDDSDDVIYCLLPRSVYDSLNHVDTNSTNLKGDSVILSQSVEASKQSMLSSVLRQSLELFAPVSDRDMMESWTVRPVFDQSVDMICFWKASHITFWRNGNSISAIEISP